MRARCQLCVWVLVSWTSLLLSSCTGLPRVIGDAEEAITQDLESGVQPAPGVLGLARELDWLECCIDKYGSVVPKHADVWGQARLMMHRQEYELEMRSELNGFKDTLQGSLARSDQAFLASAMSLQVAVASRRGRQGALRPTEVVNQSDTTVVTKADGSDRTQKESTKTTLAPDKPTQVTVDDPTSLVSGPDTVISRNKVPEPTKFGYAAGDKLALEPTLHLDQKNRYLKHLQELRRINEGDDNSDAPGYALNLVRIPVSVLTGACTKAGWGAECTVTASPHLNDDLLPTTFRNLVIKDIVDLLTLPLTRVLEPKNSVNELADLLEKYHDSLESGKPAAQATSAGSSRDGARSQAATSSPPIPAETQAAPQQVTAQARKAARTYTAGLTVAAARQIYTNFDPANAPIRAAQKEREKIRDAIRKKIGGSAPTSRRRVAGLPLPPSQLVEVFDDELLAHLAIQIHQQVSDHLDGGKHPYHLDVHNALQEELKGAYNFLSQPESQALWALGGPALAKMIRTLDRDALILRRDDFLEAAALLHGIKPESDADRKHRHSVSDALAWAILVESALLNDRLLEDMKQTHTTKGCPCPPQGGMPFYLPDPPPEARKLFNDYVRCRWPLYVFAIDPVTEDQNIADAFSQRRETQLALSLAFTSGRIGARTMTRYMRRLEIDMQTIALNRTVVGFSHGPDTFGWRFFPRFQTPPIPSNPEAFFCDLLWGGQSLDRDLCHRRLENGVRECVALVVMPSFVPNIDLDFHANWFELSHPKCKALTNTQAMRLSHKIQALRGLSGDRCDEGQYRPGDRSLLLNRLEQLSARLPLQHQLVNVPYENTFGGFELFSTGTSDLAPELIGWYGGAGINPDQDTSLFLVGDHFSVHQTRVVVGGVALNASFPDNKAGAVATNLQVELLSRQIMRVIIPKGTLPKVGPIDAHVGTPYGVSNHLSIPVVGVAPPPAPPPPPPPLGYVLADNASGVRLRYQFVSPGPNLSVPGLTDAPEGKFRIDWNVATGNTLKLVEARFAFKVGDSQIEVRMPVAARDGYFEVADSDHERSMTRFAMLLLKGLGDLRRFDAAKPLPGTLEGTVTLLPVSPSCPASVPNAVVWPIQPVAAPPVGALLPAPTPMPTVPAPYAVPTHDVKGVTLTGKIKVELQHVQIAAPRSR